MKVCISSPQEEHENGNVVGLDVSTGEPLDPVLSGIYDNYLVKKQILQSSPIIASQLLLVDEVGSEHLFWRRVTSREAGVCYAPAGLDGVFMLPDGICMPC